MISKFHSWAYSSSADDDRNLIAYKQLGQSIGSTLDDFTHREEFVSHWKEKSDVDLNFQDRAAFLVPSDIEEEFKSGMPLLLESEGEFSFHLYMQTTDQVMSMVLPIQQNDKHSFLNVILTLLFYLVVITVLLAWLYPLINRLVMLQKAANHLGTGDLSSRVSASKYSYISSIENDFNRMANQIQKLVEDNKLLSRAVSHNLKTPITRLRMGVDVIDEATDKSDIDNYIKRINYDLDEMESLVDTLLQYSSLDEFKLHLNSEPVDLCQFIPNLIENENTTSIGITTNFSNGSIVVNTDPRYLAMCLVNILSNAIQHANGIVEVRVELKVRESNQSEVLLSIEDDGCGISENDQPHVTKPFWRGVSDPAINGHGMGLAIVARIAEWLKTDLTINNSTSLGGASISMLFRKS